MDKYIETFLEVYDWCLEDILMENNLTKEDVVYALNEIGLLDLERIINDWEEQDKYPEETAD